jgi:hypothetical protein
MAQITITIDKGAAVTSVESLLWKYGKSIEGAENYKQVYNTHAAHGSNAVDNKVLTDSFVKRSKEAIELMRDFLYQVVYSVDDSTGVTLDMPTRWASNAVLLQAAVSRYVEDGMMADWLNVTAPSEATIYTTRLPQDTTDIRVELYSKRQP